MITEKTGWTPQQISSLTLKQIKIYVDAWSRVRKNANSKEDNPDFDTVDTFNLAAGIERVRKPLT